MSQFTRIAAIIKNKGANLLASSKSEKRLFIKKFKKIIFKKNLNLIHLNTFYFHAQKFYKKQGYEVFGVLDDCPKGHKRYFMKKKIYR